MFSFFLYFNCFYLLSFFYKKILNKFYNYKPIFDFTFNNKAIEENTIKLTFKHLLNNNYIIQICTTYFKKLCNYYNLIRKFCETFIWRLYI
jgi:hypothetical protein